MSSVSTGTSTGTYGSWVTWLEAFRAGVEPPVDGLPRLDGGLGPYVEARLLDRLSSVVTERIRRWRAELADDMARRPPLDATTVAGLRRDAEERLAPLARLAASPLLPRPVTAALTEALADARESARHAVDEARRRLHEEGAPASPGADGELARHTDPSVTAVFRRGAPGRFPTVAEVTHQGSTASAAATPPGGLPVPRPRGYDAAGADGTVARRR